MDLTLGTDLFILVSDLLFWFHPGEVAQLPLASITGSIRLVTN